MGKKPCRGGGPKALGVRPRPVVQLPPQVQLFRRAEDLGKARGIVGDDDSGRSYDGLGALWRFMGQQRDVFYACNERWWVEGYEHMGETVDPDAYAMIGDDSSEADLEHSRAFLAAALARRRRRVARGDNIVADAGGTEGSNKDVSCASALEDKLLAMDLGAGIGRVTRGVLLPAVDSVVLVEQSAKWQQISPRYICSGGDVHAAERCYFLQERLESFDPPIPPPICIGSRRKHAAAYDLVWIQWTLQYLIDADVVGLLMRVRAALSPCGFVVLKENRPHMAPASSVGGASRVDPTRSQMDTPKVGGRFDIARSDVHLATLVELAGLEVEFFDTWDEVGCYVLTVPRDEVATDGASDAAAAYKEESDSVEPK